MNNIYSWFSVLNRDIILDDTAFLTASSEMAALKERTVKLKSKLEEMYGDLISAMDTPSGKAVDITAQTVLLKPIEDMLIVIEHVSSTLSEIIGESKYKDVFTKYEELNNSIKK